MGPTVLRYTAPCNAGLVACVILPQSLMIVFDSTCLNFDSQQRHCLDANSSVYCFAVFQDNHWYCICAVLILLQLILPQCS